MLLWCEQGTSEHFDEAKDCKSNYHPCVEIRKEQSEHLKKDFTELFETLQRLEVQLFISRSFPARRTNMFSWLLGLNSWLQRSCSIKGVNFIDNLNIFLGHRQLFKLDGLHLNRLGARVLKDNIYFWTEYKWPQDLISALESSCGSHIPQGHW